VSALADEGRLVENEPHSDRRGAFSCFRTFE